jgi:hypothetical protein
MPFHLLAYGSTTLALHKKQPRAAVLLLCKLAQNNRHALGADLRLGVRFTPRVEGSMFLLLYPGLFL